MTAFSKTLCASPILYYIPNDGIICAANQCCSKNAFIKISKQTSILQGIVYIMGLRIKYFNRGLVH